MNYQHQVRKKQEQVDSLKSLLKSENNRHIIDKHEQELRELKNKWVMEILKRMMAGN